MSTSIAGARHHLRSWRAVVALYRQMSPRRCSAILVASLLAAAVPALQVYLTAAAIQSIADAVADPSGQAQHVRSALMAGAGLAVVAVAGHGLAALDQYLRSVLQFELSAQVGQMVMAKGTRMDLQQFEDSESYDTLQRAMREGGARAFELFTDVIDLVKDLVVLVTVSAVLASWNPWLALCIILTPLPSIFANMSYGKRLYELEYKRTADRRRAFYYQYLTATDSSFKEVRLFGLEPYLIRLHGSLVRQFFGQDRQLARRQSLTVGLYGLITVVASSLIVIYALWSTVENGEVGRLAGYIQAIASVQLAATGLLMGLASMYQANLFLGNLFAFLDLPEGSIRGGSTPFPARLTQGIEFRGVSFKYPGTDVYVLRNLSFQIPAGGCTALVGENGAGKTTMVKLLTRLYEPTSGQILVDGVPIEEFDLQDLRENIGVIFQDFVKYEMSLRTNIGVGKVQAMTDDARLQAAAHSGGAAAFTADMPDGLETVLGRHFENGRQLSIGQWQKVALSRAFMREAKILILDEPTAAIDAAAESEIFERFRAASRGVTSLLIAHRFSTVRMAQRIVVIDDGSVAECGTHGDLMALGGIYARLFTLQAAGYRVEEPTRLREEVQTG